MIVNSTFISHRRQDPQFLYLASNAHQSGERRRKEFQRLDSTNLVVTAVMH